MQINITGKNIKITPNVRDFINKKIQKIIKDFERPIDCNVILTKEKKKILTEIIIHGDRGRFYFKKSAADIFSSVEETVHAADLSIKKFKDKQKSRKWKEKPQRAPIYKTGRIQIVDYKLEELKPMSLEEAFLQMKYLKKNFIIFINAKTEKTNVMYREDGNVILLKPASELKVLLRLLNKSSFERLFIEYKGNKIKIKRKERFEPSVLKEDELISTLKNRNRFVIFKNAEDNLTYIIFWIRRNTIGRYRL